VEKSDWLVHFLPLVAFFGFNFLQLDKKSVLADDFAKCDKIEVVPTDVVGNLLKI
jgi:hypothetical protein